MTQWIDREGPDDEPVVRVEDTLTGDEGSREESERRPGGVQDVHGDARRNIGLQTGDGLRDVDDDVADGLQGSGDEDGPEQRAGGAPAKAHGDPALDALDDDTRR